MCLNSIIECHYSVDQMLNGLRRILECCLQNSKEVIGNNYKRDLRIASVGLEERWGGNRYMGEEDIVKEEIRKVIKLLKNGYVGGIEWVVSKMKRGGGTVE